MDLPREYFQGMDCGLDAGAIEPLLTVNEFLQMLYIMGKPDQTLYQPDIPQDMGNRRTLKKLVDWGLMTVTRAETPEQPRRVCVKVTPDGQLLTISYANETQRLTNLAVASAQLTVASLPSPNAV